MELDDILNSFECYKRVQELDILNSLLTDYLRTHELAVSDETPNQGREIRLMRDKSDLSSRSVIFHEKCEIGLYLDFGYSEEEVRNGTAYKKSYLRAHDIAERVELQLLQHVARVSFNRELPLYAIFPTRHNIQLFDPELKIIKSRIHRYLPMPRCYDYTLVSDLGLWFQPEKFVPLEFNSDDIKASFEMFERFGSEYQPEFKEKCLHMVKQYIERRNVEDKYAWDLQQQALKARRENRLLIRREYFCHKN